MKFFKFFITGILFGIILTKSEAISWYRIYEMFRFESFHMYGILGSAVITGALIVQGIKLSKMKNIEGDSIVFLPHERGYMKFLFGGTIFGLGWALTGACPGPMYILFGNGYTVFIPILLSAFLGTLVYGWLRPYLPH
jgi:hypothetical protein